MICSENHNTTLTHTLHTFIDHKQGCHGHGKVMEFLEF